MPLQPGAEPYHHAGGPVGVLLIHGFTGSPVSMRPWGEALAESGLTVSIPRLPGHGTRWQDLALTRWDDWYSEVDRNLTLLQTSCDRVVVGGLSMGGSLALRLGELRAADIAGLVLVNPAVHSERKDRHLLPYVRHLVKAFPGITNDIHQPDQDEGGYSRMPLHAAHSLSQAWLSIKADIALITAPMLLLHSREDHVVEPSNVAWVLEHATNSQRDEVWLERSYHVATLDYDLPVIIERTVAFADAVAPQAG